MAKQVHRARVCHAISALSCYVTMQNHCLQDTGREGERARGPRGQGAREPGGQGARELDWCHLGYVLFPHTLCLPPFSFLRLVACLGWWYLILSLTRHVVLKSEILGYHNKLLHSSLVRLQGTETSYRWQVLEAAELAREINIFFKVFFPTLFVLSASLTYLYCFSFDKSGNTHISSILLEI